MASVGAASEEDYPVITTTVKKEANCVIRLLMALLQWWDAERERETRVMKMSLDGEQSNSC